MFLNFNLQTDTASPVAMSWQIEKWFRKSGAPHRAELWSLVYVVPAFTFLA